MSNVNTNTQANAQTEQAEKPTFREGSSRALALELFTSMLPKRAEQGNTEFRKSVIAALQEQQNMSLASAAATYNVIKKYAVANDMCEDFGRTPAEPKPAKKAKKATTVNVVRKKDGEVVAEGVTQAEAEELIEKARKAKKAALQIAE